MSSRFLARAAILIATIILPLAQSRAEPFDQSSLRINEFMASNTTVFDPADGEADDWFEIYNAGPDLVDLQGLYLTDDLSNPTRFQVNQTLTVAGGGYALIWADGETGQGSNHVDFKLERDGEEIGIFDTDGSTLIDGYTFGVQTTDVSEGRCPDGGPDWYPLTSPTPGATNVPCGPAPVISNVAHAPTLPSSSDAVAVTAIITDDQTVVSATLYYSAGIAFAPEPMTFVGGDAYAATVPPQPDGTWVAYYIQAADNVGLTTIDPPSAPNNVYRYLVGYQPPLVYLNEFMADNEAALEDPDEPGEFPDWIELYNPGPNPVDLGGLYLTDDLNAPAQFRITDSLTLAGGGYLVFYADNDPEQGALHTNFALSALGEAVGLFGAEGTVQLDSVVFPAQQTDRTYGRLPDGTGDWGFQHCRTPGTSNQDCYPVFLPLTVTGQ